MKHLFIVLLAACCLTAVGQDGLIGEVYLSFQSSYNPVEAISPMKETPALHKPFDDVQAVLAEIREYNENLWLCCLLTYGCLLRPHQEIRQLTWGGLLRRYELHLVVRPQKQEW